MVRFLALVTLVALCVPLAHVQAQSFWRDWDEFDEDEWDNGFFDDVDWDSNSDSDSDSGFLDRPIELFGDLYRDTGDLVLRRRGDQPVDHDDDDTDVDDSYRRPGSLSGVLEQEDRPWSGGWWPRKTCGLAFANTGQGLSPFEKYDTVVYNMYDTLPGATAWEADPAHRHNSAPQGGATWAGHCNGLAAAAILCREPRRRISVPLERQRVIRLTWPNARSCRSGLYDDGKKDYEAHRANGNLELTIDDMKGWLSEIYMNCETQQVGNNGEVLGRRYNSSYIDEDDPIYRDIEPHHLHRLLDTYVRKRGQSFVVEVDPHRPVNNHPVYEFDCAMKPEGRYTYVTTKVYLADYARERNFVGTNTMTRTYTYVLVHDSSGRITDSQWTGSSKRQHPDFVWIPVGDRKARGTYENPCFNADFVQWLYRKYGAYGSSSGSDW